MENKELLQAMQVMIQENNKALGLMMDEKLAEQEKRTDEKFTSLREEMSEKLYGITDRLDTMQTDITAMQEDITEIKEDTAITRSATNSLVKWADDVSVITQIKFPVKEAK